MYLSETQKRQFSRVLPGTLLAVVLLGSFFFDRTDWPEVGQPDLVAGESTYLMQAESLAHDFDLAYTRADFDRFLIGRGGEPPDLELASGSRGRRIAYDRPFPYALWLAPFVRLAPEKGFAVANAVLLAVTAVCAALALQAVMGVAAPFWVAVLLFASVAWSYVWLASGDLFLMTVVVAAFALVARDRPVDRQRLSSAARSPRRFSGRRWLAAGALLAIPLATEPLYGVLVLAVAAAVLGRGTALRPFLLGLAACLLVQVSLQWWWSGGLHFFATTSFRFTPETGFPLVDFTAAEWRDSVRRFSALYWEEAPRFSWGVDPLLWLWNVVYLALGRHIGLLPYFLPLVLVVMGASLDGYRRWLAAAIGLWVAAVIVLHPFNLFGGEGAVANRLFLPLYGASWFLFDKRPERWPPRFGWPAAVVAVTALFVWRLWTAPWSPPFDPAGGYRYITPVAERVLPFETSQRRIPGLRLADHLGLRLELLNEGVWVESRRERLMLDGERRAEMVIASPTKVRSLRLDFGKDAPSSIKVRGARLEERTLAPDGSVSFRLRPGLVARRHKMWWIPERQWLHVVAFELPSESPEAKPLAFQLLAEGD